MKDLKFAAMCKEEFCCYRHGYLLKILHFSCFFMPQRKEISCINWSFPRLCAFQRQIFLYLFLLYSPIVRDNAYNNYLADFFMFCNLVLLSPTKNYFLQSHIFFPSSFLQYLKLKVMQTPSDSSFAYLILLISVITKRKG